MTAAGTSSRGQSRGRPVLGGVSGLMFGFFMALNLVLLGVVPLSSPLVIVFPIVGLIGGIALGRWAPIGR